MGGSAVSAERHRIDTPGIATPRRFPKLQRVRLSPALRHVAGIALGVLALGCRTIEPEEAATAVLTGTVRRGPITPVCQIDQPCDAPLGATFHVRRGGREIATFVSGADGAFTVKLPPGDLIVVPDASAPLMNATSQERLVNLRAGALTEVNWTFDTGIR